MAVFTVRIPDEKVALLEHIAAKLDRTRAYVIIRAIEEYVAREEWQLAETAAGLAEAERETFVRDDAVSRIVRKYTRGTTVK
jgi:predicted transcriptional regulator